MLFADNKDDGNGNKNNGWLWRGRCRFFGLFVLLLVLMLLRQREKILRKQLEENWITGKAKQRRKIRKVYTQRGSEGAGNMHTIFHSINGLGEVKMNVWWQHHTVTLSFSNYLLFFSIFSISFSLLFSLRECQHYNFIRVASFSLASYYVCVTHKHLYTLDAHPLLSHFAHSPPFMSRLIGVSRTCYYRYSFFPSLFLFLMFLSFAVNNVISNAHKFTHNFILARSPHSVRYLFISNENVNHLPFAHLKGFLKAEPHRVFLSSEIFLFGSARHTSP